MYLYLAESYSQVCTDIKYSDTICSKIGVSIDPIKRVKTLRSYCKGPVRLYWYWDIAALWQSSPFSSYHNIENKDIIPINVARERRQKTIRKVAFSVEWNVVREYSKERPFAHKKELFTTSPKKVKAFADYVVAKALNYDGKNSHAVNLISHGLPWYARGLYSYDI